MTLAESLAWLKLHHAIVEFSSHPKAGSIEKDPPVPGTMLQITLRAELGLAPNPLVATAFPDMGPAGTLQEEFEEMIDACKERMEAGPRDHEAEKANIP